MGNTSSSPVSIKGSRLTTGRKNCNESKAARKLSGSTASSTDSVVDLEDPNLIISKEGKIPFGACDELLIVREWVARKDVHDLDGMGELMDERALVNFIDAEAEMPAREFRDAMADMFASMPDTKFYWTKMELITDDAELASNKRPNTAVVVVRDYYGAGTHTGTPFKFGPYPPIEAYGKHMRDDDIGLTFYVNKDTLRIVHLDIDAFGKTVGPPGFYTKLGGIIM